MLGLRALGFQVQDLVALIIAFRDLRLGCIVEQRFEADALGFHFNSCCLPLH